MRQNRRQCVSHFHSPIPLNNQILSNFYPALVIKTFRTRNSEHRSLMAICLMANIGETRLAERVTILFHLINTVTFTHAECFALSWIDARSAVLRMEDFPTILQEEPGPIFSRPNTHPGWIFVDLEFLVRIKAREDSFLKFFQFELDLYGLQEFENNMY